MNIAELIAELQKYPADATVILVDADTQWDIPVIHIERERDGTVCLFGEYHEMDSRTSYARQGAISARRRG